MPPKGKKMRTRQATAMLGLMLYLVLSPCQARATERGVTAYPDGIANFDAGAFPPPGVYLQYTFLYYNAPRIRANVPADSHGEVIANILRLVYSSKVGVLGGNWGAHLVIPLLYMGSHLAPQPISDYQFGVSNIAFSPFILAWHLGEYHITTGMDTLFPASYNPKRLASPAQNYFTFQPVLGLGWLPQWGLAAQIKLMYDFPTINYDPLVSTGARDYYKSGQAFHFDYCLDYAVTKNLRLGVAGFYYVQTTADVKDGHKIGNHGRQFALGPALKYDYQRWSFMFIPQFEMATLNRAEGQRYWVRVWYAF